MSHRRVDTKLTVGVTEQVKTGHHKRLEDVDENEDEEEDVDESEDNHKKARQKKGQHKGSWSGQILAPVYHVLMDGDRFPD